MRKPVVYIASAYTKGDVAANTHFQCRIFDQMLTDGKALPVAPLMSHFNHLIFPRPYQDWINYDLEMLPLYDACVRLTAEVDRIGYAQHESSGADGEVAAFKKMGKPVFTSLIDLYRWIDTAWGTNA